jgi:hypothetical protein
MAACNERKHVKESNYCCDNKSPVKTSFPCTTMGIDSPNFQEAPSVVIQRVAGNHTASASYQIRSEMCLRTRSVPPLLNSPARIREGGSVTFEDSSLREPVNRSKSLCFTRHRPDWALSHSVSGGWTKYTILEDPFFGPFSDQMGNAHVTRVSNAKSETSENRLCWSSEHEQCEIK